MQMLQGNPLLLPHSLQELLAKDTVQVALVPERKGLFLKHVEYEVSSQVPTDHVRGGRVWAGMCAEEGQGAAGRRAEAQDRVSEPRRPAGLSLRLVAQPRFAIPALQDAASQDARPGGRSAGANPGRPAWAWFATLDDRGLEYGSKQRIRSAEQGWRVPLSGPARPAFPVGPPTLSLGTWHGMPGFHRCRFISGFSPNKCGLRFPS